MLHLSTQPSAGTGLGRNAVRKLIWMYGDEIRFDNPAGVGTTFYLRLPASLAAVAQDC